MTDNKGVIQPVLKQTDFVAGKGSPIIFDKLNDSGDWTAYLPTAEAQYIKFETYSCTVFSALNSVETQFNFLVSNDLIPQITLKQLKDLGFFDENGKFNCSDWFTARMAGTTKEGTRVDAVWDSIRNDGLLPEKMLSLKDCKTQEEYFSKVITPEMKAIARKIKEIFEFKYEWVVTGNCGSPYLNYLKEQIKQAPLHVAHPLCNRDSNGVLTPCGVCVTQHCTLIYNINELHIENFDHYSPFKNKYKRDYPFPWVMKGIVLLTDKQKKMTLIEKLIEAYYKLISLLK